MEKKFYEEYKWTQLKFWQNFWDYYKLHIFIVALAVAMLVIGVRNTKGRFYCVQFSKTQRDGSIVFNLTMTPLTPILTPFLL